MMAGDETTTSDDSEEEMASTRELPSVAELFAPLLERVAPEHRPLLVAIAERMAAERYRGWAEAAHDPAQRADLLACAAREEEIAERVESLVPDAAAIQADIRAKNPDLEGLNESVFADYPVEAQYRIQAAGERVGAATWRSLARNGEPAARQAFLECAELGSRAPKSSKRSWAQAHRRRPPMGRARDDPGKLSLWRHPDRDHRQAAWDEIADDHPKFAEGFDSPPVD
jgi:hypothetical protein